MQERQTIQGNHKIPTLHLRVFDVEVFVNPANLPSSPSSSPRKAFDQMKEPCLFGYGHYRREILMYGREKLRAVAEQDIRKIFYAQVSIWMVLSIFQRIQL